MADFSLSADASRLGRGAEAGEIFGNVTKQNRHHSSHSPPIRTVCLASTLVLVGCHGLNGKGTVGKSSPMSHG